MNRGLSARSGCELSKFPGRALPRCRIGEDESGNASGDPSGIDNEEVNESAAGTNEAIWLTTSGRRALRRVRKTHSTPGDSASSYTLTTTRKWARSAEQWSRPSRASHRGNIHFTIGRRVSIAARKCKRRGGIRHVANRCGRAERTANSEVAFVTRL